jgi:hypothetical protein
VSLLDTVIIALVPVMIVAGAIAVAVGIGWGVYAFLRWLAGPQRQAAEPPACPECHPEYDPAAATVLDLPPIRGGRSYVDRARPGRANPAGKQGEAS